MKNQKENIGVIISIIIVVGIIGFVIYFLINKVREIDPNENNIPENKIENQIEKNDEIVKEQTAPSKNQMEKIAKNGDVLVMNYTGRLTDGTIFDSNVIASFNHVEPFKFTLGAGQVIAGWDEGLLGMKIGEKKTLTIPPEKGYGSRAVSSIPANSTLIFDVELVGIE